MSTTRTENFELNTTMNQESKADINNTSASCDDELYYNGKTVFVIDRLDLNSIQKWVKEVAIRSNQKVDWYWSGYSANVVALGDFDKINQTIKEMLPALNQAIAKHLKSGGYTNLFFTPAQYTAKDVDYYNDSIIVKRTPCFN